MTIFFTVNNKFSTTHAHNTLSSSHTSFKLHWGWLWDFSIQSGHKFFPWLQTFITRKLRGIQIYYFFQKV